MYFRLLHDERSGAMSYLLADLDAGEAVLIDPRGADVPVLAAMLDEHQLRLRWLLRTHEHDAQLPGEAAALDSLGAPRIQHQPPPAAGLAPHAPRSSADAGHAVLTFGGEHVQVLRTPGHTAGCLSYLWRDRLFCGGLLAMDACPFQPRPALPEALWDSVVNGVFRRPAETLLFSGHAQRARAVSNVLEQRRWHPWFGGATRDEFLARVRDLPPAPAPPHGLDDQPLLPWSTDTMPPPYALTIDLTQPLPAALETLRAALAAEQMGIVSEVDVQATLKAKLGLESHPQRLLGICSPRVAHAMLSAEPDIGALLPCGCGISEAQPGLTRIALQDPMVIAAASTQPAVHEACRVAAAALQRVMARLAGAA